MDEAEVLFRCLWCGWEGTSDDMDMDEHDEPAYCPECGHGSFDIRKKRNENDKMKKYLVVLSPRKKIPEDGWDVALDRIRLYVNAENAKAAREMAVEAMEVHRLYCKVVYIRELKGE